MLPKACLNKMTNSYKRVREVCEEEISVNVKTQLRLKY
jgi:hypothetical protein